MTTTVDEAAEPRLVAPPQRAARLERLEPAEVPDVRPDGRAPHRPVLHDGFERLALRGDLSASDRPRLAEEIERAAGSGPRTIYIDLSAVTHVDAVVSRLFLSVAWRLEEEHRTLLLINTRPEVRRTLRWYGAGYLIETSRRVPGLGLLSHPAAARSRRS